MLSFKKNQLEWLICRTDFPFKSAEWKSLLSYFNKRDRHLKKDSDTYDLDVNLMEKGNPDYHIHFNIIKYLDKNKEKFSLKFAFHEEPSKKVLENLPRDYKEYKIENFNSWFLSFLDIRKIHSQIKSTWTVEYKFDVKKYSTFSGIPFGKQFEVQDGDILGTASFSGFSLKFVNSKIGLVALNIYRGEKNFFLYQRFIGETDFTSSFFDKMFEISEKVTKIFIIKN